MTAQPEGAKFVHQGSQPSTRCRVLVIACGALAHEIVAIKSANRWDHLDLICLPAILHNHPERIAAAVERTVRANREKFDRIWVAYGDCGTGGGLATTCDGLGVEMIDGAHCYAFFEGITAFADHDDEIAAFYLTDFLVRQFDAFVWEPLGLDRHPCLQEVYFGNYTTLVYLAQTDDPHLERKARECAQRLGLSYVRRLTGYGDLAPWLARAAG